MRRRLLLTGFILGLLFIFVQPALSQETGQRPLIVRPGDTWTALALRYDLSPENLLQEQGTINRQRQPVIGQALSLPGEVARHGRLLRPYAGGLLQIAAQERRAPWTLALQNTLSDPFKPLLYNPLLLPDQTTIPRELPYGFRTLSLSPLAPVPGEGLLLWARGDLGQDLQVYFADQPWIVNRNQDRLLAMTATGAFFEQKEVLLSVEMDGRPLWTQPWRFAQRRWNFEQVDFQPSLATDPEIMRAERERLQAIWSQSSPAPLWRGDFQPPLQDFVELTSHYGARRSVNGGAYDSYHEGTDYSAFGGTPVYAPGGGQVVVSENLQVRGGAVILDHGLGIHTGYYHLSQIDVQVGQVVEKGHKLGEVGSTGRSTGNHLHWDLLVGTTWIDAQAFMNDNMPAKIQMAWGAKFPPLDGSDMP